jgi:hypothetical protein
VQFDFGEISLDIKRRVYPMIGSGSARAVFDLKNGYVVKKAVNRKGLEQNKAEYQIASMTHSDLFAKIIAISDDYIYLIMEKAEKVRSLSIVLSYFNVRNIRELFRRQEYSDITSKYHLLLPDFYRHSNWGLINGRPVIIDYGFTKEVRRFY